MGDGNKASALFLLVLAGSFGVGGFTVNNLTFEDVWQPQNLNINELNPYPVETQNLAYDFNIGISDYMYVVKNIAQGVIYANPSSSNVFNWLLGSGGYGWDGCSVYVEAGAYHVDGTWYINKNGVTVTFASTLPSSPNAMGNLVGSGTPGAVLTADANLNNEVLWVNGNNVVITGATINGNAYNQFHGYEIAAYPYMSPYWFIGGIMLMGQNDLVQYSTVYNCRLWGISVQNSYSGARNVVIHDIGWNGFGVNNHPSWITNQGFCINSEVYRCSDLGLDSGAQNTIFTGNYVYDIKVNSPLNGITQPQGSVNSYWGIGWEDFSANAPGPCGGTGSGTYAICNDNLIANCNEGVLIYPGLGTIDYVLVAGNTIINCGSAVYGAITTYGDYNIIEFNTITNGLNGVHIGGGGNDNVVYSNTFSGCTNNIVDAGAATSFVAPVPQPYVNTPKVVSSVATPTLSVNPVILGNSITVYALASGGSGTPTGTMMFQVYNSSDSSWLTFNSKTMYSGAATSNSYTPSGTGTYLFRAVYSGDMTYYSSTSATASLTVNPTTPPIPPPPAGYYYIQMQNGNGGTTNISAGLHQYIFGTTVQATATANPNYSFTKWLLNGASYSTLTTISFAGAKYTTYTLQPEFTVNTVPASTWTLNMSMQGGSGNVYPAVGSHSISSLTQTVTASANTGSSFVSWLYDGTTTYTSASITLTAAFGETHTLRATFKFDDSTLNVEAAANSLMFDTLIAKAEKVYIPSFDELTGNIGKRSI